MIDIPQEFVLHSKNTPFPALKSALKNPNGLIAIGGDLSAERLLNAYKLGIFPWYGEGEPIFWYSPNPRLVMTKKRLHISKSLQKILQSNRFEIRENTDFTAVIRQCKSTKRKGQNGTWIDENMLKAYTNLHQKGWAKSVEIYENNQLVGGLYGVAMGKVFFGESMFSLVSNASKVALAHLLNHTNYQLIDCQVENPHLKNLGAFNIKRTEFVKLLEKLL
ncbi:MAG: leucyl/phenylalanyl-tRNA--protein transferase [Candidatus Thioglobus sp.]|nr:leucyl/phenylalanyl-tRNA--protein transferase [Candidatus Thioglobus sp.]